MNLDLNAHVREVLRWHFDPATGSPYWLRKATSLPFDPLTEIHTFDDLSRFPAVADEWRQIPAGDLIPRGAQGDFSVWETGGTTGPPTRIVDAVERTRGIERIGQMLDDHGFPRASSGEPFPPPRPGWLHLGPTGPHLVGTNVARLARLRGYLAYTVDLDPRWVKLLYREGRADEARRYTAHLVDQALNLLRTQPIQVLSATPPLLQALCEHPEAYSHLAEKIRGIVWFGTSVSPEALRLLEEELLPNARLVGWYGNTLMGIACQRPRRPGDPHPCIFTPPVPAAVLRLVEPGDPSRRVPVGAVGQVRISLLNRELFLPWHLERDRAVRVESAQPADWDDLAQVAPLHGGGVRTEGVY